MTLIIVGLLAYTAVVTILAIALARVNAAAERDAQRQYQDYVLRKGQAERGE